MEFQNLDNVEPEDIASELGAVENEPPIEFKPARRCRETVLKIQPFCPGWGSDCGSRLLVLLFWICMILEVPLHILNLYLFAKWLIGFRECWAFTASWVHLVGLCFSCGWVPYAILLADREKSGRELQMHRKCAFFFFSIGVVLALGGGPVSLWIISRYWADRNLIYKEWTESTTNAFKNEQFPRWLTDLGWPSIFGWHFVDCCAWHGPLNLGVTFNYTVLGAGKKMTIGLMEQISVCYNDLFSTTQKGSLLAFDVKTEMEELPPGCGPLIRKDLRLLSLFIFISSIIQTVLTVCIFLVYSYYPLCFFKDIQKASFLASLKAKLRRMHRTHPSDEESIPDITGPMASLASSTSNLNALSSDILINKRDHLYIDRLDSLPNVVKKLDPEEKMGRNTVVIRKDKGMGFD